MGHLGSGNIEARLAMLLVRSLHWPVHWPLHWPAHWPAASLRRVISTRRVPTSRTTHSRHLFRTSLFLFSTGQFCKERVEPLRFVRGTARAFPVLLFSVARKCLCPSRWTVAVVSR